MDHPMCSGWEKKSRRVPLFQIELPPSNLGSNLHFLKETKYGNRYTFRAATVTDEDI